MWHTDARGENTVGTPVGEMNDSMIRRILIAALLVPGVGFAGDVESPYPWVRVTRVIEWQDPAPGFPGVLIDDVITKPQIDGLDKVMFKATLTGPPWLVIYYGGPDELEIVVALGDPAPGLPGVTISGFDNQPTLSEDGTVVVGIDLEGEGVIPDFNDTALLIGRPGDLNIAFRAGDPSPTGEPGVVIISDLFDFSGWQNELGEFWTHFQIAGPGVTEDNDSVWCWGDGDTLTVMHRESKPAPEVGPDIVYGFPQPVSFNDLRQFSMDVRLFGDVVPENDHVWAIWQEGEITIIVREGDPAPIFGPDIFWDGLGPLFAFNGFGDVSAQVVISGRGINEDNERAIVSGPAGGLVVVGHEGDQIPGEPGGVEYARFKNPLITGDERILFAAERRGPGTNNVNDTKDWSLMYGTYYLVRKELSDDDPVLGQPEDVLAQRIDVFAGELALNSGGHAAGVSSLEGPGVTDLTEKMLWMRDPTRQRWLPVLRGGDVLFNRVFELEHAGSTYATDGGGSDSVRQAVSEDGI